ncbi:hypothetical protein [Sphingosinicella terrae]|uniref:hypothetical protein n=1 Tax=Sphingosinicella terrae TaxID=2172047 RepID=UPI000E0D9CE4|nr:hypothetical protein [Sphingosinicella terrae]
MRRAFLATVLLTFAAAQASAQVTPRNAPRETSWGKPGVSLEQYHSDGITCARIAVNQDITSTDQVRTLIRASRALDNAAQASWVTGPSATDAASPVAVNTDLNRTMEAYRVDRQIRELSDMQYDTLAVCLRELGYRQFRLTEPQQRELRRLRQGSSERRAFLHRLGSDAQVLESQGL